jgi:lysozyme
METKYLPVSQKYAPVVAVFLGVLTGIFLINPSNWQQEIVDGLALGLSAVGLFREKRERGRFGAVQKPDLINPNNKGDASMIKGIDVSHHNGTPDFGKAKDAGVAFAYIKATEGKTYRDPQFQPNAYNAMKAGLSVGFYHFARPDNDNKPEDEAQNFVAAISPIKYALLPVLDLEVAVSMSDEALYRWAKTFIDTVKAKTGHATMLYTGLHYLNSRPALMKLASQVPLWIAAYRSTEPSISGWEWTMWQFTDKGDIPGVGRCDVNYLKDLSAISLNKPASLKPSGPNYPGHPLKRGDRGGSVKVLQKRLNIPADGIFGPLTEQAVKNWQRLHDEHGRIVAPGKGLAVDGIVGPKTWKALFG